MKELSSCDRICQTPLVLSEQIWRRGKKAYHFDTEYLLLDEALNQNAIEIVEKDADGSVPELRVNNKSNKMVLILDGEELVGAKQNRIVNTTILVQGNTTVIIPVSCAEHGRWSCPSHFIAGKK